MVKSNHKLIVCAFVFSFIPFFSPLPLGSDLQPFYAIFMILVLIGSLEIYKLNFESTLILSLAVIYTIYYVPSISHYEIRNILGLYFSFIAYQYFRFYKNYLTTKILLFVVIVNLLAIIIHALFPSLFIEVISSFVRTIKITTIGYRGVSGLAAEPSFTGVLAVFYIAMAYWLREKGDSKYFIHCFIGSLIMLLFTRSGSGIFLLFGFLFIYYFKFKLKKILMLSVVIIAFFYLPIAIDMGRASSLMLLAFNDPFGLLLSDESLGQRVINILIGIYSIIYYPFGTGMGGYDSVANIIVWKSGIYNIASGSIDNVSPFAKYATELGLLYLIFIGAFVFLSIYKNFTSSKYAYLFLAIMIHISTFSIAFPPVWFLFAILHVKDNEHKTLLFKNI